MLLYSSPREEPRRRQQRQHSTNLQSVAARSPSGESSLDSRHINYNNHVIIVRWGKSHGKNSQSGPSNMNPLMQPAGTLPPTEVRLTVMYLVILYRHLTDRKQFLRSLSSPRCSSSSVPESAECVAHSRGGSSPLPQPGPEQTGSSDGKPSSAVTRILVK